MQTPLERHAEWPEGHVILDIAEMIRRDGSRLYGTDGMEAGVYQSALCGMTASFGRGGVLRALVAHDVSVAVTLAEMPVDAADGIERNSDVRLQVNAMYIRGDRAALDAWHRHLCAYSRTLRPVRETSHAA